MDWQERLHFFKSNAIARAAVLVVCAGGIAYGFYYYWLAEQFQTTPAWLWLFVPDSPLAVLWAALAIVLFAWEKRSDFVDALAYAANVQVGLWTAYVLIAYEDAFGTWSFNLNFYLLWLHLGMVALAFVFLADLRRSFANPRRRWITLGALVTWLALNDALDYFAFDFYGTGCSIRPVTVPCTQNEPTLTLVTFGLSALAVASLFLFTLGGGKARARGS